LGYRESAPGTSTTGNKFQPSRGATCLVTDSKDGKIDEYARHAPLHR
jgi:hypothetical protein